ncbi:unnamed protein product [Malus baccata var. baccata]
MMRPTYRDALQSNRSDNKTLEEIMRTHPWEGNQPAVTHRAPFRNRQAMLHGHSDTPKPSDTPKCLDTLKLLSVGHPKCLTFRHGDTEHGQDTPRTRYGRTDSVVSARGASEQPIHPRQVILAISLSVSSFKDARGGPRITPLPRGQEQLVDACWSPPCPGFVKINVDASWGSCDGRGFTGIVARDEAGRFLAASRSGVLATSVAMGEALAILHGCMLSKRMGWRRISIESDSLESISCLRDMAKKGSWDAFPVLLKCVRLGKEFLDCRWSWVLRPANSAADLLASRSSREVCDHVWVDRPPSSLIHVLCNDGLPCPP